uniref:Uncharacterized protein n=1 Tax=uncultured prokaryote TaxID=198431 RepID=A0A0H5Q5P7_9ZZZZ|nr:hypothetical protein [uncultured prokaryote]
MPNMYASVTLASQTGETADSASNLFAASFDEPFTGGDADDWKDILVQFYNDLRTGGMLRGYAQSGHTIKFLRAVTTVPNYPVEFRTFSVLGTLGAVDLPLEVSLCVSYANDTEVTVSPRRRKGRIYISGFTASQNAAGRPVLATQQALGEAYADYCSALNLMEGVAAGVWSRAEGAIYDIDRVWVDNEWDTMRSRGGKSTSRFTTGVLNN